MKMTSTKRRQPKNKKQNEDDLRKNYLENEDDLKKRRRKKEDDLKKSSTLIGFDIIVN